MRSLSFSFAKELLFYVEIDKSGFCFQSCSRTMLDYEIRFNAPGSYPGDRSQPEPGDRVGAQAEPGDEYLVKPDLPSWVSNKRKSQYISELKRLLMLLVFIFNIMFDSQRYPDSLDILNNDSLKKRKKTTISLLTNAWVLL